MNTRLIKLEDGPIIEVDFVPGKSEQIDSSVIKKIESSFDKIQGVLLYIAKPISNTMEELSKEMELEKAEVDIGLSFEGEGNIYITKAKAGANLNVKLILKPKS